MVTEYVTREERDVHVARDIKTVVKPKVYQIVLEKYEEGYFVATCPELPGVVTDGATRREAKKNARYAISDMLDFLGTPDPDFTITVLPESS